MAAIATLSCGGSPTTPTPAKLHGEVSDPVGDATTDPRVAVAPDLVRATIDVAAGTLSVAITFAPGTLDRQGTRVTLLLDSDQNASTGIPEPGGLGADYTFDLAAATGQATITKADPAGCAAHQSCFTAVGSASLTATADTLQASVPLTAIGGSDGHLLFGVTSYVIVAPLTPVTFDRMPDAGSGRVQ